MRCESRENTHGTYIALEMARNENEAIKWLDYSSVIISVSHAFNFLSFGKNMLVTNNRLSTISDDRLTLFFCRHRTGLSTEQTGISASYVVQHIIQ